MRRALELRGRWGRWARVGGGAPRCHTIAYTTLRAGDARKVVALATSARTRAANREGRHGGEAVETGNAGARLRGEPRVEVTTSRRVLR